MYTQEKVVITGLITARNSLLPGVNVLEKGTKNGTTTNFDGYYTITVSPSATLLFSHVGFHPQQTSVSGKKIINIGLTEDSAHLEEVVVVGFGTQNKKDVTGAIETITSDEITKTPIVSLDQSLGGRTSGVFIASRGGDAAAPINVRIRGVGTIGNNQPLFVVDGVPLVQTTHQTVNTSSATESNPLASLNPNDIESISVLKDASAGAIYGARASNGVVIITTKRGELGQKASFTYDGYTTFAKRKKFYDVLDTKAYLDFQDELGRANFNFSEFRGSPTYDWQDAIARTGITQSHNIGVSGGSENANYSISGGYLNQEGITLAQNFERYSFKANTDINVGQRFKFGESVSVGFTDRLVASEPGGNTTLRAALNQPFAPIFDASSPGGYAIMDASTVGDLANGSDEPIQIVGINDLNNNETSIKTRRLLGNLYGEVELMDAVRFRSNFGIDYVSGVGQFFQNNYSFGENGGNTIANTILVKERPIELTTNFSNTLTYSKDFGFHKLSLLLGHEETLFKYTKLRAQGTDLINNTVKFVNFSGSNTAGEEADIWTTLGFLSRINYAYDNRYLLTINMRSDSSSRFSPDNRTDYFPSVAFGWHITNEDFMTEQYLFNQVKLRASWGIVGNQFTGRNFPFLSQISFVPAYPLGVNQNVIIAPTSIVFANEELKWEKSIQTNVGVDVTLLNNKLDFTAAYYTNRTKDMLVQVPLPAVSGFSFRTDVNLGEVTNKGLELSMSYKGKIGEHFNYTISGNFSTLKNNVETLGNNEIIANAVQTTTSRTIKGQPIGQFFGYATDGLYQNANELVDAPRDDVAFDSENRAPGDVRFVDVNKDGIINEEDRTGIGSPIPTHFYGLTIDASYKGFDVSLFFQGVGGNDIYNYTRQQLENLNTITNKSSSIKARWTGPGTSNTIPRVDIDNANNNDRFSDRWIENGSYARLKNVQLGYTLNTQWLKRISNNLVSNIRLYIAGQNLALITGYKGLDPEVTRAQSFIEGDNALATGIDDGYATPQPITMQFGTRITF